MTEDDLGERLRSEAGLDTEGVHAVHSVDVARLVRRARRRAHIWATVALALWAVVGIGFFYIVYGYFVYFHPMLVHFIEEGPNERLPEAMRLLPYAALYVTAAWAGVLIAAACATVVFVYLSGQATLRQIGASLEAITARTGPDS